jgi:hypothetical protein
MSTRTDSLRATTPHRGASRLPRVARAALLALFAALAGGAIGCATDRPEPLTTTSTSESQGDVGAAVRACAFFECTARCNGGPPVFTGFGPFPGQACVDARAECSQSGCSGLCTIAGPAHCTPGVTD